MHRSVLLAARIHVPVLVLDAEEVDLDAVRRARIVRFQGGGGS